MNLQGQEVIIIESGSHLDLRSIINELKETFRFRGVISSFVETSLKQRYRHSVLGFGWSLLGPLLQYGTMGFIFSLTMRASIPNYFLYFFSGATLYGFVSSTVQGSSGIMLRNENFIKKIYLPKLVYVLNQVLLEFFNFLFSFVALVLFAMAIGKIRLNWPLLFLPIPICLSVVFMVGIASIISVITVFYRDALHMVPIFMQVAFFGTPIIYEASLIPQRFQGFLKFNPFFYFVEAFRAPLYLGELPNLKCVLVCVVLALFSLIVGLITLQKYNNTIVYKL